MDCKQIFISALTFGVALALPLAAQAVDCVNGVYKAGCVGPNGAVVVDKGRPRPPPVVVVGQPGYRPPAVVVSKPLPPPPPPRVACVSGAYRAGCVGPNGNAVVITK